MTSRRILEYIETLHSSRQDHIKLLGSILSSDGARMWGLDLVVIAVINRSIALIDGFTKMVEDRNVLCANALLRLQLDNIIRLYACWLVNDPHPIAVLLLEGKSLNKVKSKDGKSLSDAYLTSEASKLYPWLKNVYSKTSGFIHLSAPHMMAPFTGIDSSKHTMSMAIGSHGGREWTEPEILESLAAFAEATRSVLHLAYSWGVTKEMGAKKRKSADGSHP
jgi:hypothetical protein